MNPAIITIPLDPEMYSLKSIDQRLVDLAKANPEQLVEDMRNLKISKEAKIALIGLMIKTNPDSPKIILSSIDKLGFDRKKGKRVSLIAKMILLNIEVLPTVLTLEEITKLVLRVKGDDLREILPQFSVQRLTQIGAILADNSEKVSLGEWIEQIEGDARFNSEERAELLLKFGKNSKANGLLSGGF